MGSPRDDEDDRDLLHAGTPVCPKCGAICDRGLDYCQECGRKIAHDRAKDGERDGEMDLQQYLARSFSYRLMRFREDAGLRADDVEQLFEDNS